MHRNYIFNVSHNKREVMKDILSNKKNIVVIHKQIKKKINRIKFRLCVTGLAHKPFPKNCLFRNTKPKRKFRSNRYRDVEHREGLRQTNRRITVKNK